MATSQHITRSLIRLLRIARTLKWEESTKELIYEKLATLTAPMLTPAPTTYPSLPPPPLTLQAPKSYSLSLKNMIDQGASWEDLTRLLRSWWQAQPHNTLACKIVELSYIWSGPEGVEEVLSWFEDFEFWQNLHIAIRKHILLYTHKSTSSSRIRHYLHREGFAPWLTPVERLIVFHHSASKRDYAFLFRFYNKYARELTKCLEELGSSFPMTVGELKYAAALARMDQGHNTEALALLRTILPSDSLYQPASKLKRTILTQKKSPTHSQLHSKIVGEVVMKSQWEDRESTLRHYLEKIRHHPEDCSTIICVMNDLLAQKNIIPMDRPGMLSRYVGMCLEYFDLYPYIPNILLVLSKNACIFHSPSVDGAIWNHFLGEDIPDFPCTPWKAVALFHRFMMVGPEIEEALWESYELMSSSWEGSEYVMDVDFSALKKAAYAWLSDNPLHDHANTSIMQACLGLCTHTLKLSTPHIEHYLRCVPHPPLKTLKRLLKAAQHKKESSLQYQVLHTFIQNGYLRTQDLKTYLAQTIQNQKHDLSWRTITVLKGRGFSVPALEAIWQVSGENRQRYHLVPTTYEDLEKFVGASLLDTSRKVFLALLHCGHRIPELMAVASYKHHSTRWKVPTEDSLESSLLKGLEEYPWLKKPLKRISESVSHPFAPLGIPEASTWNVSNYSVCVSYLFEFLGLFALSGDLFRLSPLISLTTGPGSGGWNHPNPTKKGCYKWFRSLTDEERLGWLDITAVIQKKPSHKLSREVAYMVFRMALMLLPAHRDALKALRQLRMPLPYLRDLEMFILSDPYTQYRSKNQLAIKVPVPSYASLHQRLQERE